MEKEVTYLDHAYTMGTVRQEMDLLKNAAIMQANASGAAAPIAFVYTPEKRYLFPVKQFADFPKPCEACQREVTRFAQANNVPFWIVVGITQEPNKFAAQYKDYTLNIVAHVSGEKIIWQKHTLLMSGGLFTVIESKEDYSAINDDDEAIKKILEAETNENEFDVEGVEVAQNPFA